VVWLYVGIGAFLGANARYWVGGWAAERFGTVFPYGTFIINVTGSFAIGLLAAFFAERGYSPSVRLFLMVGVPRRLHDLLLVQLRSASPVRGRRLPARSPLPVRQSNRGPCRLLDGCRRRTPGVAST
jgi:CrcB-like protein involved in camphor resistance